MRKYVVLAIVSFAAAIWLMASPGAQNGLGHVRGTVKDAKGTPVPGVTLVLTGPATFTQTKMSDERGEFAFPGLPLGSYRMTATLAGFQQLVADVTVLGDATASMALVLQASEMRLETADAAQAVPQAIGALMSSASADAFGKAASVLRAGFGRGLHPGFNTESYDRIDDNHWTEVGKKSLSTFSVDVDTASYSNVRRFLNEGSLPPRDAVRIEELINYFAYDYPEPRDEAPVAVTTALAECPWDARHRLALIGLQARRIDSSRLPPRNLVFLVDVSGSMEEPTKLPLVKDSLAMLARNLTEKDRIAIVVYAGAAGLVLPPTPGSDSSTIIESLDRLRAGGSTNGAQGIQLAYDTAQRNFIKGGVNRVILATDGDFNVGVTNEGDLTRLIEEKRETGITLSVLGYGMGNLKDSTMEALADRGNGNYFYIDSLTEAQKVLVQEAGGTLVTVAKDVKLQVEFNPRTVAAYRLVGYENRLLDDQDFNDDRKDAGDMGAGHSVTALYELVPAGGPLDLPGINPLKYQQPANLSADAWGDEAMTVTLRYKQPEGTVSSMFSATVPTELRMTPELGFAAAVAEFGMLLRESEFKGSSSFAEARSLATRFKGSDRHGHRAEFIRLIGAAEGMGDRGSR